MKLRIRGDSLRLRLSQSDVARIAEGEAVIETTRFAATTLRFGLHPGSTQQCDARFGDGEIAVEIPLAQAQQWARSDEVGIEALAGPLAVLIEKDFSCLEPRAGEEDGDTFPNPKAS